MMKRLFVFICLLVPAFTIAQQGFEIGGRITGLAENAKVSLIDINKREALTTTEAKNGAFVLKGEMPEANIYQLSVDGIEAKTILFIGNEKVTVSGSAEDMQNLEIKGSSIHNDFVEMQTIFNPLMEKLMATGKLVQSKPGLGENDSLAVTYKKQMEDVVSAIDRFVVNKKSSPMGAFLLVITREMDQDETTLENRFKKLDASIQKSFYGKILEDQIAKSKIGAIGSEAIDFTQNDTTGKPVSLASFRGKYVLVDFWASWCRPCRVENPNVVSAYKKFKSKNFTVLGVSLDRARDSWIQAIHEDGLTWTHVSDLRFWQNEAARKYNIESIPQNLLIGPDGRIVAKNLRGPALEEKLCELLGCE